MTIALNEIQESFKKRQAEKEFWVNLKECVNRLNISTSTFRKWVNEIKQRDDAEDFIYGTSRVNTTYHYANIAGYINLRLREQQKQ